MFYTLLGLLAATTGFWPFQRIMTNAWVHLGFAGLFALSWPEYAWLV